MCGQQAVPAAGGQTEGLHAVQALLVRVPTRSTQLALRVVASVCGSRAQQQQHTPRASTEQDASIIGACQAPKYTQEGAHAVTACLKHYSTPSATICTVAADSRTDT
jgi:hypothetical protein